MIRVYRRSRSDRKHMFALWVGVCVCVCVYVVARNCRCRKLVASCKFVASCSCMCVASCRKLKPRVVVGVSHFGSLCSFVFVPPSAMSLHSSSKDMGLPSCVVGMIDEFAACSSTPHHAVFAAEHGPYSKAVLCGWSPELVDGRFRNEWCAATPPFYDEPSLFVDVAVCEVVPCVLCCPLSVGSCRCCAGRVCSGHFADLSRITADLPVSPPLDLRGHLPVFLLQ